VKPVAIIAALLALTAISVGAGNQLEGPELRAAVEKQATDEKTILRLRKERNRARRYANRLEKVVKRQVNRAEGNERKLRRFRAIHQDRLYPSVAHAMRLASVIWGVPVSEQKRVAYCESKFWPYAQNGQYLGVFQLGHNFQRRGVLKGAFAGFSVFDIYANVFTAALTVRHDGSWRQWECKP
jgi:hypothetical protein